MYEYIFLDTHGSVWDPFRSRILNPSSRLLLHKVLSRGYLIDECSSQQLTKDLQL